MIADIITICAVVGIMVCFGIVAWNLYKRDDDDSDDTYLMRR